MNWLQKVMYGRYGGDRLNLVLLLFSIVISVVLRIVSAFTGLWWLPLFTCLPLLFCIYRMFSKNIARRRAENDAFLGFFRKFKTSSQQSRARRNDKTHCYYRCPSCRTQLRVPKGRGKISITCPKCRTEFIKKT